MFLANIDYHIWYRDMNLCCFNALSFNLKIGSVVFVTFNQNLQEIVKFGSHDLFENLIEMILLVMWWDTSSQKSELEPILQYCLLIVFIVSYFFVISEFTAWLHTEHDMKPVCLWDECTIIVPTLHC